MKLIIGMAVEGYKYDPKANRNEATKDIATISLDLGHPLGPGHCAKMAARSGTELLPRQEAAQVEADA